MRLREVLDRPELRLTLLVGAEHLDRPINRVFTTDLPDPRRYLAGGELVLTGLMWRRQPEDSLGFVAALATTGVAALGAGDAALGCVPPDLVEACRRHDLPLLEVPEEVSFAAIAAAIAERVRAERALATDLLRALAEPADPGSLRAAVLACELPAAAAYVVLVAPGPAEALADLVQPLAAGAAVGELSAELAAAVVPRATGSPAGEQPAEWATALAAAVTTRARAGNARIAAGVGGPVPAASALPGALAEARYAQRAAQARTARPVVVSGAELASHVALLAAVPAPALAAFRGRLLDPLVEYDRTHQAGLVHTLTEFLDCNGSWSRCAEHLHVHVNTLRYRLSRVELLTGRDLDRFADRVDFFLALRSGPS